MISLTFFLVDAMQGKIYTGSTKFQINSPPQGCRFSIDPKNGTSLFTNFSFSVRGCADEDSPIAYEMSISQAVDVTVERLDGSDPIIVPKFTDPWILSDSVPALNTTLYTPKSG